MPKENSEPTTETIAETDNYLAWKANEPDGEVTYHLELNNVTLHFFREEWQEFLELVQTGSRLGLSVPEYPLQDRMFFLLRNEAPGWVSQLTDVRDPRYRAVSAMLAVATRLNVRTEEIRGRLTPLEEPVAEDPTYWP